MHDKKTPDRYSKASSSKAASILPALNSKRQTSEKPPSACNSRATGQYTSERLSRNPQVERVLFPTQIKETFLERNAHLANPAMTKFAADHARA